MTPGATLLLLLQGNADTPPVEIDDVTAQQIIDAILAGPVKIDLTPVVPATGNTANSIADCLNAARADGFGKWTKSGTTLTLYAPDGTTVVRAFTLNDADAPTVRT